MTEQNAGARSKKWKLCLWELQTVWILTQVKWKPNSLHVIITERKMYKPFLYLASQKGATTVWEPNKKVVCFHLQFTIPALSTTNEKTWLHTMYRWDCASGRSTTAGKVRTLRSLGLMQAEIKKKKRHLYRHELFALACKSTSIKACVSIHS